MNKEVLKKSLSWQFCITPDPGQFASRSPKTPMELKAAEQWAEKEYVCMLCLGVATDLQEDRGS